MIPQASPNHTGVQARCYDFYTSDVRSDIEALQHFVGTDQNVLEIGVGTGRVAAALHVKAREYLGIDISDDMLRQARFKVPKARFLCADMRHFNLGEKFDRIIFPFRVIQYCRSINEISDVLKCVACHLSEGGKALLNVLPLGPSFAARWHDRTYSETFVGPNGEIWRKEDAHHFYLEMQLLERTVSFYRDDCLIGRNDESIVWLSAEQATEVCRAAGLDVVALRDPDMKIYQGTGEFYLEASLS